MNVFTYIFSNSKPVKQLNNAVVVNISEKWLLDTINSLNNIPNSGISIFDNDGNLLLNNSNFIAISDSAFKTNLSKMLKSSTKSGYITSYLNNKKTVLTYYHSQTLNWTFICSIPYDTFIQKLNNMRNNTIKVALLIFTLGLFFSWFISMKLYKPIYKLNKDLSLLRVDKNNSFNNDKQAFLRSLLLPYMSNNLAKIEEDLSGFSIKVNFHENFFIIMISIAHYNDFCKNNSYENQKLFKYAIENITLDIFSKNFLVEFVETNSKYCILFLNGDSEIFKDIVNKFSLETSDTIKKYLKESITLTIGPTSTGVENINTMYTNLENSYKSHLLYGCDSILYYNDLIENKENYNYPLDLEKKLREFLTAQNIEEVNLYHNEIINLAIKHSYNAFNFTIIKLTTNIITMLNSLEVSTKESYFHSFDDFIIAINSKEALEEINLEFSNLYVYIISLLKECNLTPENSERNKKAIEYILVNFKDPNLSLEIISSKLKVSANYLGRNFKKEYGNSIADHINKVRLERAKELLNTNKDVDTIALELGFSSSKYFCTLFKKSTGLTTTAFRNLQK